MVNSFTNNVWEFGCEMTKAVGKQSLAMAPMLAGSKLAQIAGYSSKFNITANYISGITSLATGFKGAVEKTSARITETNTGLDTSAISIGKDLFQAATGAAILASTILPTSATTLALGVTLALRGAVGACNGIKQIKEGIAAKDHINWAQVSGGIVSAGLGALSLESSKKTIDQSIALKKAAEQTQPSQQMLKRPLNAKIETEASSEEESALPATPQSSDKNTNTALQLTPNFCDDLRVSFNATRFSCPTMSLDHATSAEHLHAMQILKSSDVQDILINDDDVCPYMSPANIKFDSTTTNQYQLLEAMKANPALGRFLTDQKFHQELKNFNELVASEKNPKISKGELIRSSLFNDIDISKLHTASSSPSDSTMTKLLKSITGIRHATSGDKDIALVLTANPTADHNGAFSFHYSKQKEAEFWRELSIKHPIHFAEVSSTLDVYDNARKIKKLMGNIKVIELRGHGKEKSIMLDKYPQSYNEKDLLEKASHGWGNLFTMKAGMPQLPVDSDGAILLKSCSTGKGGLGNPNNLVNQIASTHAGVTVAGYAKDAGPSPKIIDVNQRKFSFLEKDKKGVVADVTYRAKGYVKPNKPIFEWLPSLGSTVVVEEV